MLVKKLFNLSVGLFLLTCSGVEVRKIPPGFEDLSAAVSSLYRTMGKYDIKKYYIREHIRGFFCTEEDMDGFIFEKNYQLSKEKIRDGRVIDFRITGIEEYNENVGVGVSYRVRKFFPLLKKVIHTRDEWIKTEEGWCLIFRKRINIGG